MEQKGELKGPYTLEDWLTMKAIKSSLTYLKERKPSFKRSIAIKWQEQKFREEIDKAA